MLRFYLHFGEFVVPTHLIRHGVARHAAPPSPKGKACACGAKQQFIFPVGDCESGRNMVYWQQKEGYE